VAVLGSSTYACGRFPTNLLHQCMCATLIAHTYTCCRRVMRGVASALLTPFHCLPDTFQHGSRLQDGRGLAMAVPDHSLHYVVSFTIRKIIMTCSTFVNTHTRP
jgi:hypothetical protein